MKEGLNCLKVYVMLIRLKLKIDEGKLVGSLEVGSRGRRARLPQSPTTVQPQVAVETPEMMSHEGEPTNMIEDEMTFKKALFDMKTMVKVLSKRGITGCKEKVRNLPKEKAL